MWSGAVARCTRRVDSRKGTALPGVRVAAVPWSSVCPELRELGAPQTRRCGVAQDPRRSEFTYLWLCAASQYPSSCLYPSGPGLLPRPSPSAAHSA